MHSLGEIGFDSKIEEKNSKYWGEIYKMNYNWSVDICYQSRKVYRKKIKIKSGFDSNFNHLLKNKLLITP